MQSHSMALIRRMCELGARPAVIQSYFREIAVKTIRKTYREITGLAPSKGQLPDVTDLYFEFKYSVQSSLVAKVYADSVRAGSNQAEALIHAYEMLVSMFQADRLTFSQVSHLTRYVQIGQFVLIHCQDGHVFLVNNNTVFRAPCPVCKEMAKLDLKIERERKQALLAKKKAQEARKQSRCASR